MPESSVAVVEKPMGFRSPRPWGDLPIIVIDTETTGIDRFYPASIFHSLLGLAAHSSAPTHDEFYSGAWSHPVG